MAQSYFVWNGKDCRGMGVTMRGPAAIIRPEERVRHIEIPGVSGDLTETEGENIFNSYIQTVSISVRGGFRVREIYNWLRGAGYVTFSGEPDRKQAARIIGAVTLNRISRNLDKWAGEVQFYCQPLKEKMDDAAITITSSGAKVQNSGDVISKPLYRIEAAGEGSDRSGTLTVTGDGAPELNTIAITNMTGGSKYWIDTETMEVWNNGKTALRTKYSTGNFPVLVPGENTITFSGISEVQIIKRERFL